jgi:hypothetical protein
MSASMDTELIQPGLATDLFRSQILVDKMECDASTFDHKVLDRALNRVGCDPNILVWMFLSSKNEDDFVFADELQEQVQEDGTSYSAVTIAAPVAGAGNKRKR